MGSVDRKENLDRCLNMAAQGPALPPLPQPTEYFRKYGSTFETFLPPNKSGLTPLEPADDHLTAREWAHRSLIRKYQQRHLEPFTSNDIVLSNSLHDPSIGPSDLKGIHQIFAKENWDTALPGHLAFYPLGNGRVGEFYRADNPDVWRVLQPILALTSKFLDNCHIWPWWDALVHGERAGIAMAAGRDMFFPRTAQEASTEEARDGIRQAINGLVGRPHFLRFGIASGYCAADSGLYIDTQWKAVFVPTYLERFESNRVYLSYHKLSKLIFGNLTEAEKLIIQFEVAICLFHEMAHAVGHKVDPWAKDEPFFDNEDVCELGYSMMNAVFGGRDFSIGQELRDRYFHLRGRDPFGLIFQKGFPTTQDVNDPDQVLDPVLAQGIGTALDYVVPARFVSDIQKEKFWTDRLPRFGLESLRPQPLGIGLKVTTNAEWEETKAYKFVTPSTNKGLSQDAVDSALAAQDVLVRYLQSEEAESKLFTDQEYDLFNGNVRFMSSTRVAETLHDEMACSLRTAEIRNLLMDYQAELAFPTMVEWTPSFLVLDYIHRLLPGQVSREDFEEFLVYCEYHNVLFEYRRRGEGEMRTIDEGWDPLPPKAVVARPARQREFQKQVRKFRFQVFNVSGNLCDIDKDLFYMRLTRLIAGAGGAHMSRSDFDAGLAYIDYRNRYLHLGPAGIVRNILRGAHADPEDEDEGDDDPDAKEKNDQDAEVPKEGGVDAKGDDGPHAQEDNQPAENAKEEDATDAEKKDEAEAVAEDQPDAGEDAMDVEEEGGPEAAEEDPEAVAEAQPDAEEDAMDVDEEGDPEDEEDGLDSEEEDESDASMDEGSEYVPDSDMDDSDVNMSDVD